MWSLPNLLLACLAVAAGGSFVAQQTVNANLRAELGSAWWAGCISYAGGTLAMLVMILLLREPLLSAGMVGRSTWWSWTGGLLGAFYIAVSILLLPRLGATTVVGLIVVGQMLTSVAFDHFALMGAPHYPISSARFLGAVLLIAGAVLTRL